MSNSPRHPTDTTLILALDGELPPARRSALDRHLMACQACRSRLEAFEDAARDATRACREGGGADPAATSALRLRLQRRMTELGTEWNRSPLFRFQRAARSVPALARVGVSLAFLVLVVRLVQPHMPDVVPRAQSESLPIGHFTPGATGTVSVADLCSGNLPTHHVVSMAVRQRVLRQYRMEHVAPSEYELDFLITPELGGLPDARNLWPERYDSDVWHARVKDDLEALLPRLVCDGVVDLGVAQREIAGNWIDAYKKYFKTEQPLPTQAGLVDDDEILFEGAPHAPITHSALVSFAPPRSVLSAELTTNETHFVARTRTSGSRQ